MAVRDIIVVAASAGGVDALVRVVRGLPPGLPASLFVACHLPAGGTALPEILSRSGPLLATHPADGEAFHPAHVYVAPPDRHLLLDPGGKMRLSRGPRENHQRPAADPLFRSAARHYGPRVVGVVLSGSLNDGTAGLLAVRSAGGLAVVQDPADALVAAMPLSAARIAGADFEAPADGLGPLLAELIHRPVAREGGSEPVDPLETMPDRVRRDQERQLHDQRRGEVSLFTCPECGGALWQVDDKQLVRFRCHVGHVYNGEALLADQSELLEAALWTAVRTFRDKALLARQLAARDRAKGETAAAARFDEQADQAQRYGELILRHVLGNGDAGPIAPPPPPQGGT
jgi:two-component system chemotaxis response regulator CheB